MTMPTAQPTPAARTLTYAELFEAVRVWFEARVTKDSSSTLPSDEALEDYHAWADRLGYAKSNELHVKQAIARHTGRSTQLGNRRGWRGWTIPNLDSEGDDTPSALQRPQGALGLAVRIRRLWLRGHLGPIPCSEIRPTRYLLELTRATGDDLAVATALIRRNLGMVLAADVKDRRVTARIAKAELHDAQREQQRLSELRRRQAQPVTEAVSLVV
ncbi:hypothetical protein [Rhodococcus sp. APC 3903]|uniref:hypothetical protein n=1 Tax=Rhodococcus sp. APC 3903 TaxID=3035193 RepID=UPI0025B44DF2|nr:hypothetical protein [Rhodococcus sp. APC 3903]MDN3459583.1 hypothetical protein [Rhodococcus sp. APC 3903]